MILYGFLAISGCSEAVARHQEARGACFLARFQPQVPRHLRRARGVSSATHSGRLLPAPRGLIEGLYRAYRAYRGLGWPYRDL